MVIFFSFSFPQGNRTLFGVYQLTKDHETWDDLGAFKHRSVSVFIDFPLNPFIT
jgi:hypothetical protein